MNNLFKMIIFTFAFFFILSNSVVANSTKLYKDVTFNHWAFESITKMKNLNIMVGKNDGMFYPKEPVTRAETVQYFYKALNLEKTSETNYMFEDVPHNATYKDALYTLTSLGVIENTKKFYPNNNLTRAQVSKLVTIAFNIQLEQKNEKTYRDISATHWAKDYIASLIEIDILKGTSNNTFSPNGIVTRAQMATILDRALTFQKQLASYEVVYDYLQKDYITTIDECPNWSSQVIKLVNVEREKQGLPQLKPDSRLAQLAVIKGKDMVNRQYFEHSSPFYGNVWDMAGIFDYSFESIGENLARNYTSPEAVVQAWLGSTSHKNNMMNKSFTNIGVACVSSGDGQLYWVQLLSRINEQQDPSFNN